MSLPTITTTRRRPKQFSWSYSKLKNYETCAFRYQKVDVEKAYKEEEGEALTYGNEAHAALAKAIGEGVPLPKPFQHFDHWVQLIVAGGASKILVEQKLAIDAEFNPCDWSDWNRAWYRGVADVIKIVGNVALVVDFKTGKVLEDGSQLALMAACVFAHYPKVKKIRTEYLWLKEDATTRANWTREEMVNAWKGILPRVQALQQAHDTNTFPPKQGGLCRKWCCVTECKYHGG